MKLLTGISRFALAVTFVSPLSAQAGLAQRADSVMRAFVAPDAPGCAVAIDYDGEATYRGAFGMATMEFPAPITVGTIFEAGSVSKQFTAAAVLLLAARGTLSLDDTLQRWFPEIPVYQAPITIRHLMLHTSGLRDWGAVAGLAGWPRGSASYNHADALAIIARQRGLNHLPGAEFSYTNSGYNLMAMLVARATGISFAEFTRREFFVPLGMSHTSWRDDFARIVPGRAQAYARADSVWRLEMPFEFVHGNGGLLTTVDDLLIWTRAVLAGRIGSPDVSGAMRTNGRLNDGRLAGYGGGLYLTPVLGVAAIHHTGATAAYRAALGTFPDQRVSMAILCNRADATPARLSTDILRGIVPFGATPTSAVPATAPYLADQSRFPEFAGMWRSDESGGTLRTSVRDGQLFAERRPGDASALRPTGAERFSGPGGATFRFSGDTVYVSVARATNVVYVRDDVPSTETRP